MAAESKFELLAITEKEYAKLAVLVGSVDAVMISGEALMVNITESLKVQVVMGSVIRTSYSNVGGPGIEVSTL